MPVLEQKPAPVAALEDYVETRRLFSGSVNDLQRGFEQLLINQPHQTPAKPLISPIVFPSVPPPQSTPVKAEKIEVPVTRGLAAHDKWFADYSCLSTQDQTAFWKSACPAAANPTVSVYSVYCNNCNDSIPDAHYHCSTCDDGDFDLCQPCVSRGVVCGSDDHWLIKRSIKDGKVVNSTTETLAPRRSFSASKTTLIAPPEPKITTATRTCNNCIAGTFMNYLGW